MESQKLGRRAFSILLGKEDVVAFHRVLWYRQEDDELTVYVVLTKSQLIIIQIEPDDFLLKQKSHPHIFFDVSYSLIDELLVHNKAEDHFFLSFSLERPPSVPAVMHFGTCYRKSLTESFQVVYASYMAEHHSILKQLKVSFVGREEIAFNHVAAKMFNASPQFTDRTRIFYRRGYMFAAPARTLDKYQLMDNRPCGTYTLHTAKDPTHESDIYPMKHMVIRFLPEKPISPIARDSPLAFQQYVENVAHSIALASIHASFVCFDFITF